MSSKLALLGGQKAVRGDHVLQKWPPVTLADRQVVISVLDRGELAYYGRDGWVRELEDRFARYHDTEFALAVDSGTQALHSAFFGLGFGPGDEVLVPTYTFVTTVTPLLQLGVTPRLCDCDPETGNILPAEIEKKTTNRTRGVVVTHMWGHPCEMNELTALARARDLRLVEDCSHAHGARYRGRTVGTFGDAACFSLQAKKIITGGTGGIMITSDRECYERAVLLGHYRKRSSDSVTSGTYKNFAATGLGQNYRMHPLAAALAASQFDRLDEIITARTSRHTYLSRCLAGIRGVTPPVTREHVSRGAFHGYKPFFTAAECPGIPKDLYVEALRAEGVAVEMPGSTPFHRSALYKDMSADLFHYGTRRRSGPRIRKLLSEGREDERFPNCESFLDRVLDHTTFTYEPFALIDQYAEAFAKVYDHLDELQSLAVPHQPQQRLQQ
jgi:dTDP-4-amino-4,6-dideoxygalactose transaminase